jgi:hypothetical protein
MQNLIKKDQDKEKINHKIYKDTVENITFMTSASVNAEVPPIMSKSPCGKMVLY